MSALAKLNEVLFENSDSIPEGLYLQLMNLSKGVFDETEKKAKPIHTSFSFMPTTYKIREMVIHGDRVRIGRGVYHDERILSLHERGGEAVGFALSLDDNNMFQCLTDGKDKKFFVLKSINKYSIRYEIQFFRWFPETRNYDFWCRAGIIRIAKQERGSAVILPVDIGKEDLTLINYASQSIRTNWINCSENLRNYAEPPTH